jgi:hypothetical protein
MKLFTSFFLSNTQFFTKTEENCSIFLFFKGEILKNGKNQMFLKQFI